MTHRQHREAAVATMRQMIGEHVIASRVEHAIALAARAKMLRRDAQQQIRDAKNTSSN